MSRALSHTELSTALTCQARWDFAYGGRLAGTCLRRRAIAPILSNGRAWGAAVAAWHAFPRDETLLSVWRPMLAQMAAHGALRASYVADIDRQREAGVWVPLETQLERENWLGRILDHYMATATPLENLTKIEEELNVPIPSRTGKRSSSRYRFQGFIDGFETRAGGVEAIVEFKLRTALTPIPLLELSRQIRYYAWARQQQTGIPVVVAIVDERLAEAPKSPRIVKAKRKSEGIDGLVPSHAKDQMCLPEDYIALCQEFEVEPDPETVESLKARQWQQRHPIWFHPGELEEAGQELVSGGKLIHDLDSGDKYPIRNSHIKNCRGCKFIEACPRPEDRMYLETIYEFTEPKRLRPDRPGPDVNELVEKELEVAGAA